MQTHKLSKKTADRNLSEGERKECEKFTDYVKDVVKRTHSLPKTYSAVLGTMFFTDEFPFIKNKWKEDNKKRIRDITVSELYEYARRAQGAIESNPSLYLDGLRDAEGEDTNPRTTRTSKRVYRRERPDHKVIGKRDSSYLL